MKSTLGSVLIFAAGAAIGSVVTWKLIEARYKKLVEEDHVSMDEYYRNKYGVDEDETVNEEKTEVENQVDIREYAKRLADQKYVNYSNVDKEVEEVDNVEKPYVIPPEEYGELEGYRTVTLYYHADGVLTDDQNEIVEDADDVVGEDFSEHYGEYEDDSVCVRNDAKCTDYEILYDHSTYYGGINKNPRLAEDE